MQNDGNTWFLGLVKNQLDGKKAGFQRVFGFFREVLVVILRWLPVFFWLVGWLVGG